MSGRWIRQSNSETTIVFVHGINSNEDAFRSSTAFWPDLVAADLGFSDAGVFAFEYRSKISAPGFTLGDAVDYLREILRLEKINEQQQIVFVCHSMGGNLVRRYLVMQSLELAKRQTRCGLFLLACPSTGSHYANLFRLIRRNYHMQLESLVASQKNVWLNDLDRDFKNLLHDAPFVIVGRELAEDVPIIGRWLMPRTQVVPPQSAMRYFGEPQKVPGSDHFTISAPIGPTDFQHRVFRDWFHTNFPPSREKERPELVAEGFMATADARDYKRAWELLDDVARKTLVSSFDEFEKAFSSREELGSVLSRKLVGTNRLTDPPGYAKGTYQVLNYFARYSLGGMREEVVYLRNGWDGSWKPFGFRVSSSPVQGAGSDQAET